MIAPESIVRALLEGRCLRTQAVLGADEFLVSRAKFGALYAGMKDDAENRYIQAIFKGLTPILNDVATLDPAVSDGLRRFMAHVLYQRSMASERYLHQYLFAYWDDAWHYPEERIAMGERYCEGQAAGSKTPFARNLLPCLGAADAYPDIVGLGLNRDLVIVELKLNVLDDRALGQILRYYSIARAACDRTYHDCDIRRIYPVLIVYGVPYEHWEAIPSFFREFLHIFSYRVDPLNMRVILTDTRRTLDTQTRERWAPTLRSTRGMR